MKYIFYYLLRSLTEHYSFDCIFKKLLLAFFYLFCFVSRQKKIVNCLSQAKLYARLFFLSFFTLIRELRRRNIYKIALNLLEIVDDSAKRAILFLMQK